MANKYTLKNIKTLSSLSEALPLIKHIETLKSKQGLLNMIKHDNIDIKIEGLKSLQKVGGKDALPTLIKALTEASKKLVIGSEEATAHKIYVDNLCKTISSITGKNYTIKNIADTKEFDAVIQQIKEAN